MDVSNFNIAVDNLINKFNDEPLESQCRLTPLKSVESDVDPQVLLDKIRDECNNIVVPSSVRSNGKARNEMVLEHAEAVIEYQRDRINSLEKTIEKFNDAITKTNDMYKDELQKYASENKDLRIQMQNVISDYEALSNRFQAERDEYQKLKEKVIKDGSEMIKKDEVIRKLNDKMEVLPKENEFLKEERRRLLDEVKVLKDQLMNEDGRNEIIKIENDNGTNAFKHMVCDVRKQENIMMSKCLIQVENDLMSYKRLSEDQKMEIERLNNVIDDIKRTNLRPDNFILSTQKQMLQFRQLFITMVKQHKCIAEDKDVSPSDHRAANDIDNRSLHMAYILKATSEHREMYDKLLNVVKNALGIKSNTNYFYSFIASYRFTNDLDIYGEYTKRSFDVNDGFILIHILDDLNEHVVSTKKLLLTDLISIRRDFRNLEFTLSYSNGHHIIKLDNSDYYNRLYYALLYSGFIVEDKSLSIHSNIDFSLLEDNNWPVDLVPIYYSTSITNHNNTVAHEVTSTADRGNVHSEEQTSGGEGVNKSTSCDVYDYINGVSVILEPKSCLFYYDYNLNCIVINGPNMATRPNIIFCGETLLFAISKGDFNEDYVILPPPLATFPNGNPCSTFFSRPVVYGLLNHARIHYIIPRDSKSSDQLKIIFHGAKFASINEFTSQGLYIIEPVADLREEEGQVNRGAPCNSKEVVTSTGKKKQEMMDVS